MDCCGCHADYMNSLSSSYEELTYETCRDKEEDCMNNLTCYISPRVMQKAELVFFLHLIM